MSHLCVLNKPLGGWKSWSVAVGTEYYLNGLHHGFSNMQCAGVGGVHALPPLPSTLSASPHHLLAFGDIQDLIECSHFLCARECPPTLPAAREWNVQV